MPALLILAPSATADDGALVAEQARTGVAMQASPIVVAIPPDVDAPPGARVVRVKRDVAAITAIRIGMAQLTNTTATSVLIWPFAAARVPMDSLLALIDATAREPGLIAALANADADAAPMIVPRDAWLELVTLGEGGLSALATRRRVVRVESPWSGPAT
jgi:hypothetical protein